jgi:hypothetical protein
LAAAKAAGAELQGIGNSVVVATWHIARSELLLPSRGCWIAIEFLDAMVRCTSLDEQDQGEISVLVSSYDAKGKLVHCEAKVIGLVRPRLDQGKADDRVVHLLTGIPTATGGSRAGGGAVEWERKDWSRELLPDRRSGHGSGAVESGTQKLGGEASFGRSVSAPSSAHTEPSFAFRFALQATASGEPISVPFSSSIDSAALCISASVIAFVSCETDHLCPNGSVNCPYFAPQNWSASGIVTTAPAATAVSQKS